MDGWPWFGQRGAAQTKRVNDYLMVFSIFIWFRKRFQILSFRELFWAGGLVMGESSRPLSVKPFSISAHISFSTIRTKRPPEDSEIKMSIHRNAIYQQIIAVSRAKLLPTPDLLKWLERYTVFGLLYSQSWRLDQHSAVQRTKRAINGRSHRSKRAGIEEIIKSHGRRIDFYGELSKSINADRWTPKLYCI